MRSLQPVGQEAVGNRRCRLCLETMSHRWAYRYQTCSDGPAEYRK